MTTEESVAKALWWLVGIQGLMLILLLASLAILGSYIKDLVTKLLAAIDNLTDKINLITSDLKPVLEEVKNILSNLEPLSEEIAGKRAELGSMIEKLDKIADDAQVSTATIREKVVPVATTIGALFAGIAEGTRVFVKNLSRVSERE